MFHNIFTLLTTFCLQICRSICTPNLSDVRSADVERNVRDSLCERYLELGTIQILREAFIFSKICEIRRKTQSVISPKKNRILSKSSNALKNLSFITVAFETIQTNWNKPQGF